MKAKLITVNGKKRDVAYKALSHEQLEMLAHGPSSLPGVATITYSHGPAKKPNGSLLPGESVALRNGMNFTVVHTNKA